jgi:hypothetical protein
MAAAATAAAADNDEDASSSSDDDDDDDDDDSSKAQRKGGKAGTKKQQQQQQHRRSHAGSSATPAVTLQLSLRPSLVAAVTNTGRAASADLVAAEVKLANKLLANGVVVSGFVSATGGKGCFVRIARGVTARVLLKNLAVRSHCLQGLRAPPPVTFASMACLSCTLHL